MTTRSARTLSRHYAKLAVISAVPLVLLILALGYVHYSEQKLRRLDTLMVTVSERHEKVERMLASMSEHTFRMQQWMAYHLAGDERRLSPVLALLTVEADPDTQSLTGYFLDNEAYGPGPEAMGNFLGNSLALSGGNEALTVASLAVDMFAIQQLGHVADPAFLYSYFLDGRKNFLTIYPASDRYDFQTLSDNRGIEESVRQFFRRSIYDRATPEKDANRKGFWVDSERDGVRGRAVVSRAAPVYNGDAFVGVVGVDVLQSHFASLLAIDGLSDVASRVVDEHEDIIAYLGDFGGPGYRALDEHIGDVASGREAFTEIGDWYYLRLPLRQTGWHLEYAIPVTEIQAGLAWRFLPYGLILCGVIATLVLGQLLVRAQFVRPVLAFAQYLREGARGEPIPAPDLPRIWKPWISILSATFKRNNESLALLRESEDRYRRLVELSPDAVMLHDSQAITFLNPAGCRILGVDRPEAAIGRSYMEFVAEDEKDVALSRVREVIASGREVSTSERAIVTDKGERKEIEIMATPFVGDDGSIVGLAIFRDVTARNAMARAVRESEGRFRAISEAIPLPILISDAETFRIVYSNPAAHQELAANDAYFAEASLQDLSSDQRFRYGLAEVVRGRRRVESSELEVRKANGETFWARVTTVPMTYQGKAALIHAIVDLSERVQAEAEIARQRESFHQKEKIAALGSLLAGLAHELNNPLSVVSGQSLMLEEAVEDDRLAERARRIREAAERCSRTVRTFLSMARSRAPERTAVALNDAVMASVDLVAHSLQSSGVEVKLDLDPELSDVMADGDQLHHLVSNLIINAEHAMRDAPGKRVLSIATGFDAARQQIVLTVADTGPGVPEDILARIFEPFFTTKPGAAGTGIGLALCRDIAQSHGGDITYSQNEPTGAIFKVRLPLPSPQEAKPDVEPAAVQAGEAGTILVVDDDEEVALTLADVLRMQGHEVDTVFGAKDGIERARHKPYDIIISDVRMPDVDGPAFYKALESEVDDLEQRMMFMTGDTLRTDLEALVEGTDIPVIEKPLDPRAVAAMIAGKLRENRGTPDAGRAAS